ncbi:transcriptional regulator, LacI family [Auraticoccus monumenti]|uniref:Transcriptional regulator, LacI family n=1 Tax=Auraticoccus monumenti TaxID=675864 RepID=A0A1G7A578_9ACTN|nr:transcriptional regulator, LacI family [Auraticoccus monumenti]
MARYAGVSSAVVSYVVNGGPRPVSEETSARVRSAIDLLGYRPNVSARALRIGSTSTLGLVLGGLENPYFTELALSIQAAANEAGYAVVMGNVDRNRSAASSRHILDDLIGRQVDGFLVASENATADTLEHLQRNNARSVVFDAPSPIPGHSTVGPDAAQGARSAVEHLVSVHGHRDVGLVIGDDGRAGADARERGWQDALRSARLLDGPLARADFTRAGGYEGARRLLEAANPPSAVFASSELQGIGVLYALHEAGVRVPEDVAVVTFDGTAECEYSWPSLTVARQPVDSMAAAAVRQLLTPGASHHETFPMELVVRRSCGCVPQPTTG